MEHILPENEHRSYKILDSSITQQSHWSRRGETWRLCERHLKSRVKKFRIRMGVTYENCIFSKAVIMQYTCWKGWYPASRSRQYRWGCGWYWRYNWPGPSPNEGRSNWTRQTHSLWTYFLPATKIKPWNGIIYDAVFLVLEANSCSFLPFSKQIKGRE